MRKSYVALLMMCVGVLLALVIIEWAVGCGQVTYYPNGTWTENECVFLQ